MWHASLWLLKKGGIGSIFVLAEWNRCLSFLSGLIANTSYPVLLKGILDLPPSVARDTQGSATKEVTANGIQYYPLSLPCNNNLGGQINFRRKDSQVNQGDVKSLVV
jgi:hypothetical protein